MIEILLIILAVFLIAQTQKLSARVMRLETDLANIRQAIASGAATSAPADITGTRLSTETIASSEPETGPAPETGTGTQTTIAPPVAAHTSAGDTDLNEPRPPAAATASARPLRNLESHIGARWPVWVGGVALAFGGIFLVRYSIEAGLLGPQARLLLAALFGLLLVVAGEIVRRRGLPNMFERDGGNSPSDDRLEAPEADNRLAGMPPGIPGALTAAGAVTLLGAVYAAHAVYGLIGPTGAFGLLSLVSFSTIALSLLHGQALAGLGLLAALLVPAMVDTKAPNATALFLFITVTWFAVNGASRIRRWTVVPMLANLGTGIWELAYAAAADNFDPLPAALTLLAMIAGTIFLWPGRGAPIDGAVGGWRSLTARPPLKLILSLSVVTALSALALLGATPAAGGVDPLLAFTAVIAALAAVGMRRYGLWAAVIAALAAIAGAAIEALADYYPSLPPALPPPDSATTLLPASADTHAIACFLLLGGVFTALGFAFLRRFGKAEPTFSALWAVLMGAMPAVLGFISLFAFGHLGRDWTHAIYGLAIAILLLGVAEWLLRKTPPERDGRIDWPTNLVVAGSFAGLALALHALASGIAVTILLPLLGFGFLLGTRLRPWPALAWMMAASLVVVFGRIAWEPTLVGPTRLGTTPFFNALLPGYGIPTLLAILSAWLLRTGADSRVRHVLQGLAALAALTTIAVLVRHAMNGGVLDSRVPTLGEQSVYTLVTIGFSGILMTLDLKAPSPVFRWGSMLAGVIATLNVLSLHIFALNPFFSGENTGAWPFVNLLLIGYLLPALAYAAVAFFARDRRPKAYVAMLAVAGALLGFLWATLSVRRYWQGDYIAYWKGFLAGETYSYSVVWLLIGVGLLALGSRLDARSLRLASAGLVLISVVKVFLIDMANLEGILRALSFIGLGAVLIGIGLFYQRILVNKGAIAAPRDSRRNTGDNSGKDIA